MVGGCIQHCGFMFDPPAFCFCMRSICLATTPGHPWETRKHRQSLLLLLGKVIFFTSQLFCFCRIPDCQSFSIVLHWVTKYNALHWVSLVYISLHCIILYSIALGCFVLYCIALDCIADLPPKLHWSVCSGRDWCRVVHTWLLPPISPIGWSRSACEKETMHG